MFKIGAHVKWTSQSGGWEKEKKGRIVDIVSAKSLPNGEKYPSIIKNCGMTRDYVSYIVAVPTPGGKSLKYYWPRVSALEIDNES